MCPAKNYVFRTQNLCSSTTELDHLEGITVKLSVPAKHTPRNVDLHHSTSSHHITLIFHTALVLIWELKNILRIHKSLHASKMAGGTCCLLYDLIRFSST